jgi:RND family efflux transporter MFP subunit
VSSERAGRIADVLVLEGDVVSKGQVLFSLDSKLQQIQTERLAVVANSNVDKRRAQAELDYAEREETKTRNLARARINSDTDLAMAEHVTRLARVRLDRATEDRELARMAWEEAKTLLEQGTVLSPLDGVVTTVFHQVGRTIERLEVVVEIVNLDPLWIEFNCPMEDEASFRTGSKVLVRRSAGPEGVRDAVVVHSSPLADPSSQTFSTRLEMSNGKDPWKAGLKILIGVSPEPSGRPAEPGK